LIGKTIKVTQGPYKGHIGIVKVNFRKRVFYPLGKE
jgi:transcription elongation factor